ncbi:hypothetical protein OCOJLMKI_5122 [Methylobacterium iners]|uniref:Transposase IS701-like DDE domain-containing protein n=1 Tax=Methylobacterium iners TaxID=418707 RepID=A0ABQ4S428_9HYPH|nr:hypothetical protein OCOJLMKI_5122 [Methylobacterium iners]
MSSATPVSTLELWYTTQWQAKQRIRPLFAAPSVAACADAFLDGLLGASAARPAGCGPRLLGARGQQTILDRTQWDAEALRDVVRDYVVETLASPDVALVIDASGFLKQAKASCGVGRQYTDSAGNFTNCQIGVFAALRFGSGLDLHRSLAVPRMEGGPFLDADPDPNLHVSWQPWGRRVELEDLINGKFSGANLSCLT